MSSVSSKQPRPMQSTHSLSRHDKELISADKNVEIWLAMETGFAPGGYFNCRIIEVDKYAIKVRPIGDTQCIWVLKQAILATR